MQLSNSLPAQFINPYQRAVTTEEESVRHKALLDLGETLVAYVVAILFGEYKLLGPPDMKVETEFYKFSRQKPSFGHFVSFYRLLSSHLQQSIIYEKSVKKDFTSIAALCHEFSLLKTVIDEGSDNSFSLQIEPIRKGRTIVSKGMNDLFDLLVSIRNIYAHPEDKAGGKQNKRMWPLGEEYYKFVNPPMTSAIMEVIQELDILSSYKPASPKEVDDVNKRVSFQIETGQSDEDVFLDLSTDELNVISSELKYLLDLNNKLYVQLYYHTVPSINPLFAQEIIAQEKARIILPHLKELIYEKLSNDGLIDEMEMMILSDTAKTGFINQSKLFELINEACIHLGLSKNAGTPESPGEIFTKAKAAQLQLHFNPWWLIYFSMVPNIDKKTIAEQKEEERNLRKKIETLSAEYKDLPQHQKIKSELSAQKDLRKQKKDLETQLRKCNPDQKESLLNQIAVKEKEMSDLEDRLQTFQDQLAVKKLETDKKIYDLEKIIDEKLTYTQWGIHKNLWKELDQYVDIMLGRTFREWQSNEEDADWMNTTNAWQIGALSYSYWARIHPVKAPLENIFHIGYALANPFKWVPDNVHPSLKETLKKPVSVIWTSVDDKRIEKLDEMPMLEMKRRVLSKAFIDDYARQLSELGANIKIIPKSELERAGDKVNILVPISFYLERRDEFEIAQIYSRFWIVDDFYENGQVSIEAIEKYEREMIVYFKLFSNIIEHLNDYALEIGLNEQVIGQREEKYKRCQLALNMEFSKLHKPNEEFRPDKDQLGAVRSYAMQSLGLSDYSFQYMLSQYRFKARTKNSSTEE